MEEKIYTPPANIVENTFVTADQYEKMYQASIADPDAFWTEQANRLDWTKPFSKVKNTTFDYPNVSIKWFEDGELNVTANCIDRHLPRRANDTAIIFEPDDPNGESRHISFSELHRDVCKLANVYRAMGVKKGDRVCIYMPMIPEAAYAMLAAARIGAIHSVVFGGFSPDALKGRVEDCGATLIVTADEGLRGGKKVPLKANVDKAIDGMSGVDVLVVERTGGDVNMQDGRDVWYADKMAEASEDCPAVPVNAEDPLFILYTSGSTGKPKGVMHTSGGYLTYASLAHKVNFDYHEGEVYWCTADVGWVTGHSYVVYGPLSNGATTLMFEGVPNYPDASRFWQVVDKHKVNIFHSAPTAIRALMGAGDEFVDKADLSSLKILGTVGEPINPQAWQWYYDKVGRGRCVIVDSWWQTETGASMITVFPGAIPTKPGSATKPFFGVKPVMLNPETGEELTQTECAGVLAISDSWPGQMRTVYGDHDRFVSTYFEQYKGYYFTGDGARRDKDGYYWITGRVDDVLNVSGHRIGTAEVESALVSHPKVSEAAVVGYPHDIKGQGIYCYVTLMSGQEAGDGLKDELKKHVRSEIGPICTPDLIQFSPGLPKTRSGKIMRRILRKVAENDYGSLGDTSTLADPAVVDDLIANRQNR